MDRERATKLAGAAGVVFVVLLLVATFAPGSPPAPDAGIGEIRKYFVDHRSALLVGTLLQIIGLGFFYWFLVQLRYLLTPGSGDDRALGTLMVVGAVVGSTLATASVAVTSAVVWIDGFAQTASNDVIQFAWNAGFLLFFGSSIAFVVLLGAFALAVQRGASAPAWLRWLAVAGVVVNLFGTVAAVSASAAILAFVGFLVFALWVLATSFAMLAGKVATAT